MNLLLVVVGLPLLGAVAGAFLPARSAALWRWWGVGFSLAALVAAILVAIQFDMGQGALQMRLSLPWVPLFGVTFGVGINGISLPLLLLSSVIFCAAFASFGWIEERQKEYALWLLVMECGLLGLFVATDLILFFVFFEVVLIPSYFLVGIFGRGNREHTAIKFVTYTGVASAVLLISFVLLVFTAARYSGGILTTEIPALTQTMGAAEARIPAGLQMALFLAMALAFMVKMPIFPLHSWAPDVYRDAPIPVAAVLSGVMSKMGAYGILRIAVPLLPAAASQASWLMGLLGVISILYGAIAALGQKDLRLLLAYSSMSHMGVLLLGIASLNAIGLQGAVFQMVSHGLIISGLFFVVGLIGRRAQSYNMQELGGLWQRSPRLMGVFLVLGLAALGLPLTSGFIAEFQAFAGAFRASQLEILSFIGVLGFIFSASYILWMVERTAYGPLPPRLEQASIRDVTAMEWVSPLVLVLLVVAVGVFPALVGTPLTPSLGELLRGLGG